MSGGTGAVSASCCVAHLARITERCSGVGTAFQPWPLQTELALHALPTTPACARGHVRTVALEWGLPDLADTAELLVSELVTNAVRASERIKHRADTAIVPVVRLRLVSDRLSIVIHVWDGSDEMPVRQEANLDEEGGRGLMLVEILGKDWGAYREADGKVVWVMISLSGDP